MKQRENSIYPASSWRDQGSFRGEHQQGICQQFDKYKIRHKHSTIQILVQGLAPCVTRTELQYSGRLALHVWWILRSNTEDNIVYRSKICHIYDLSHLHGLNIYIQLVKLYMKLPIYLSDVTQAVKLFFLSRIFAHIIGILIEKINFIFLI